MRFTDIIDANKGQPPFRPIMQKESFPISENLKEYLKQNGRDLELPLLYNDLINYSYADALKDKTGKWTYWENAVYPPDQLELINAGLIKKYASKNLTSQISPALLNMMSGSAKYDGLINFNKSGRFVMQSFFDKVSRPIDL
jgi:hypothetical protein